MRQLLVGSALPASWPENRDPSQAITSPSTSAGIYTEKSKRASAYVGKCDSHWRGAINLMTQTASDFLIKRITEWGLKRIYGYPGDGINGVIGAIDRAGDAIDYVQVRHEEMAAFMACAHAKFTGEVGICLATSGPGAIHLLNGLYDAKMDHAPVVAIVGQQARAALGGDYQQEVDLVTLFKDVAHEYVHMASTPAP